MTTTTALALDIRAVGKSFTLHSQGGLTIPVLDGVSLQVHAGACVALTGPSGAGKSTLMRMIFGNYRCNTGAILVRHHGEMIDIAGAHPRLVQAVRRDTMGYVSQFLRVIPRVAALAIVMEPMLEVGEPAEAARARATALLTRLRIPETLWPLPPATFSGGEQQRVNIARGLAARKPILLLDEPTSSLDAENRETVIGLIEEAKAAGTAIVGIFHDTDARARLATLEFPVDAAPPAHDEAASPAGLES